MTALIFDCDGVLADTERFGHLPAFNQTFREFGLPVQWSELEYGRRLRIGGGKERLASLLTPEFIAAAGLPVDAEAQRVQVARWHARKTEIYTGMVAEGAIAARPGVARIIGGALAAGWILAVASTSAEASVRAILDHVAGDDAGRFSAVLAGDIVARKKPAPDIYLLALERLGIPARDVLVIEDSANGAQAAAAASLPCLVTINDYTAEEPFPDAALVVDSLGDPGLPAVRVLENRSTARPGAYLTLDDLRACLPGLMPPTRGQRPMVGVNWKMHLTATEAAVYLDTFRELVADVDDRDIFVLPAYPVLQTARDRLSGSNVFWGAQDVHPDEPGPHTGDVSASMLADLGCRFVMVGHTERRRDHGEDYDLVAAKVAAVARHAMVPIVCIGEPEPVGSQAALDIVLADLDRATSRLNVSDPPALVVAYEPSWAIGQGMVAAPPEVTAAVHQGIHEWLRSRGFPSTRVRVIYGGSVDTSVAEVLLRQPGVDGLFVGRAGLDPRHFAAIARTPLSARVPATS